VAIVIPDQEALLHYAKSVGKEQLSFAELCADAGIQKTILDGLIDTGKKAKLHGFEQVRFIHLSAELFTPENGLLTPSFKAKRDVLRKHFAKQIEAMYSMDNSG
jgi:long-chain acyl-CoA synthetase